MNIGSNGKYPANKLSNFTPFNFIVDGVVCGSMEGFLQSLKYENMQAQESTAKLVGLYAKRKGQKRNKQWRSKQTLWWKGRPIIRSSTTYQVLLDHAFTCLYEQNEKFRDTLQAAGNAKFTHSIGKNKETETVLTVQEFCQRLQKLKDRGSL